MLIILSLFVLCMGGFSPVASRESPKVRDKPSPSLRFVQASLSAQRLVIPHNANRLDVRMFTASTPCEATRAAFGSFITNFNGGNWGATNPRLEVFHAYDGDTINYLHQTPAVRGAMGNTPGVHNLNGIAAWKNAVRDNGGAGGRNGIVLSDALRTASVAAGAAQLPYLEDVPGTGGQWTNDNFRKQLKPLIDTARASFIQTSSWLLDRCQNYLSGLGPVGANAVHIGADAKLQITGTHNWCSLYCAMAHVTTNGIRSCSIAVAVRRNTGPKTTHAFVALSGHAGTAKPDGIVLKQRDHWVNLPTVGNGLFNLVPWPPSSNDPGLIALRNQCPGAAAVLVGGNVEIPGFFGTCSEDKVLDQIRQMVVLGEL